MAYLIKRGKGLLCSSWAVLMWVTDEETGSVCKHPGVPTTCIFGRGMQSHAALSMAVKAMGLSQRLKKDIGERKDLARRTLAKGSVSISVPPPGYSRWQFRVSIALGSLAFLCSCGIPNSGIGSYLLWDLLVGPFCSHWVASSSLHVMVCAWSYWSLLCYIGLMSLGGMLFSGGR